MSGRVTGLVLKYSRSQGNARLVAVVIADFARDDGTGAWPSVPTIGKRAGGLSDRTVQRHTGELQNLDELEVQRNGAPNRRTNLYRIRIDRLLANGDKTTPSHDGDTARHGRASTDARDGDNQPHPEASCVTPDPSSLSDPSIKNRPEPPLSRECVAGPFSNSSARTPEIVRPFEVAWSIYPPRAGKNPKATAEKAWNAPIEREPKNRGSEFNR